MLTKRDIRKRVKELKYSMREEAILKKGDEIFEKLVVLEEYNKAETILIYISYNREVPTEKIIKRALEYGKTVAVPKIDSGEMIFKVISDLKDLDKGFNGILEPSVFAPKAVIDKNTIVIVPGVAFDANFERVGYGGGYYDRFFEHYPDILKIALAYDFQLFEQIPVEAHDIKMDMILTETKELINKERGV